MLEGDGIGEGERGDSKDHEGGEIHRGECVFVFVFFPSFFGGEWEVYIAYSGYILWLEIDRDWDEA